MASDGIDTSTDEEDSHNDNCILLTRDRTSALTTCDNYHGFICKGPRIMNVAQGMEAELRNENCRDRNISCDTLASFAIDGQLEAEDNLVGCPTFESGRHSGVFSLPNWWRVDLGIVHLLFAVGIVIGGDGYGVGDFEVTAGMNEHFDSYTLCSSSSYGGNEFIIGEERILECDDGIPAKYVGIRKRGDTYGALSLCEVLVYAGESCTSSTDEVPPGQAMKTSEVHFLHGSIYFVGCNQDYGLLGEAVARCFNGNWYPKRPECQENCPYPGHPRNGMGKLPDSDNTAPMVVPEGVTVHYTCNDGYELHGTDTIPCINGRWQDNQPNCYANCIVPSPFHNGVITTVSDGSPGDSISHGTILQFTCNGDLSLYGHTSSQCYNGVLEYQVPTCHESCSTYNITNGFLYKLSYRYEDQPNYDYRRQTQEPAGHNDWAIYHCNPGYDILNHHSVKCVDGTWNPSEHPTCEDIDECSLGIDDCDTITKNTRCRNEIGSYKCDCIDGFERNAEQFCVPATAGLNGGNMTENLNKSESQVANVHLSCPAYNETVEEGTDNATRTLYWPVTSVNSFTGWVPCPETEGYLRAYCYQADKTFKFVNDFTNCYSLSALEVRQKVDNVSTVSGAMDVIDQMQGYLGVDGIERRIADILLAVGTLEDIFGKIILDDMEEDKLKKERYIKDIVVTVNSLLDIKYKYVWRDIEKFRGYEFGASSVLRVFEVFLKDTAEYLLQQNETLSEIKTTNIEIAFYIVDIEKFKGLRYPPWKRMTTKAGQLLTLSMVDTRTNYIFVPPSALNSNTTTINGNVSLVGVLVKSASDIMVGKESDQLDFAEPGIEDRLNSVLISMSVYPDGVNVLADKVSLKFIHKKGGIDDDCIWLNFTTPKVGKGSDHSLWETTGCWRTATNNSGMYTTCECDHLTYFGILMDQVSVSAFEAGLEMALKISCLISILLMLITLIFAFISRIGDDFFFVIKNQTFADVLLLLSFLMGMLVSNRGKNFEVACITAGVLFNFFYLVCFMWMTISCIQTLLRVRYLIYASTRVRCFYICLGWIFPVVLTMSFATIDFSEVFFDNGYCVRLKDCPPKLVLDLCVYLSIVINIPILISASYAFHKKGNLVARFDYNNSWDDMVATTLYFAVFVMCWGFGLTSTYTGNYIVGYVFTILIFCQASTIFLYHFATNEELLQAVRIQLCGEKIEKWALHVFYKEQVERMTTVRTVKERAEKRRNTVIERKKKKAKEQKEKHDTINALFTIVAHNRVSTVRVHAADDGDDDEYAPSTSGSSRPSRPSIF
ncbi:adhesion G protein-coupled receptor L3-like [Glandiceps talaboti]